MKKKASTTTTCAMHSRIRSGLHGRTTQIQHVLAVSALSMTAFPLLAQNSIATAPNPITWGTATNIGNDFDVRTDGTLVGAFNVGASGVTAPTINGVLFSAFQFPNLVPTSVPSGQSITLGAVTLAGTQLGELLTSSNAVGGGSPFNSLSSPYQTLLGSAGGTTMVADLKLSFGSLTVGNQYLLQIWSSVSTDAPGFGTGGSVQLKDQGGVNTLTLDVNTANATGGLGQFVVGTFTATASTVEVSMTGSSYLVGSLSTEATDASNKILTPVTPQPYPVLNGFQLRDITATAIPEASSAGGIWVLMGSLGWLSLRRRRTAQ